MSTEETSVKLGANTQEINEKIPEAATKVESAFEKMLASISKTSAESAAATKGMQTSISHSFTEIGHVVHKTTALFGLMTAAVAGGAAFSHIIGETNKWTGEVNALAKGLNISTQEASGLAVALNHVGLSGDGFIDMGKKLDRQILKNEETMNKMGMATRDSSGNILDQMQLTMNAIETLRGYEAGTSRNMAAQKLFGRGVGDTNAYLKLTEEVLHHAKVRAEELHLVVGPEGVKQMRAYKEGMADLKEIVHSVEYQMGQALMPALIQLGAWFSAIGPQAIDMFKGALNGIITFIMYLGLGVVTVFEGVKAQVSSVVAITTHGASAIAKAFKGDFAGAAAEVKAGFSEVGDIGEKALDKIAAAANSTNSAVAKMWGLKKSDYGPAPEMPKGKKLDPNDLKEGKAESRLPEWKAELDQMKLAEDAFLASSKRDDLAFWEEKRKNIKMSKEERQAVDHEILVLKKEIQREELQNDIEGIKLRMESEKKGSSDRVAIWDEAVKKIGDAYGRDSKEYKAALLEKTKLAREHEQLLVHIADSITDKNREIARIGLDIERDKAAHLREIGAISAEEELQILRKLEERKAAIEIAGLKEKLIREKSGTLEYQKLLNEIEVAQAKHSQAMQQIDMKAAREQGKAFQSIYQTMQHSFSSAIQGMIAGTMTLGQAMKMIAGAILNSFIDLGVKMLFDWVQKQVMMTFFSQGQNAARIAAQNAAAVESAAVTAAANVGITTSETAAAAMGAAAAVAPIPVVGPMLALAAAESMTAMGAGYIAMASAAGGWGKVEEDQIAQVHKDEMILPAELAEGVRSSIGKGQQATARGGDTFHISAVDGRSVKRLLHTHGADVANSLAKQARNFKPVKGKG